MVKDDWTHCTVCKFPALYTEFKRYVEGFYLSVLEIIV